MTDRLFSSKSGRLASVFIAECPEFVGKPEEFTLAVVPDSPAQALPCGPSSCRFRVAEKTAWRNKLLGLSDARDQAAIDRDFELSPRVETEKGERRENKPDTGATDAAHRGS